MSPRRNQAVMAVVALVALSVVAAAYGQNLQVQGKLVASLGQNGGDRIVLIDLQTKIAGSTLVTASQLGLGYGNICNPSFSPDGRQICFTLAGRVPANPPAIFVINNDGTGLTRVGSFYGTASEGDFVNWCTDGYIYWSEFTRSINRINVLTKVREAYWNNVPCIGYTDSLMEQCIVSNDARRASVRGHGMMAALDMVTKTLINYGTRGCNGYMCYLTGNRIAHQVSVEPYPPGISTYLHCVAIESVTVTTPPGQILDPRPEIKILYAPGQPGGPDGNRIREPLFAKNSDDYVTVRPIETIASYGMVVYQVSSGTWMSLPSFTSGTSGTNSYKWMPCMWYGPLPSPSSGGPVIALSDTAVTLTPSALRDTVSVTNTGSGTFTALTVTEAAAWLTATVIGAGNSQKVVVAASVSGLAAGTYRTNVAVSGGGADNSATFGVSTTVGSSLPSPSQASASVDSAMRVTVRWSDNSTTESGFAVERATQGSAFAEVGRTPASVAQMADPATLAPGTYLYRVRAFDASSYSGYSDTAQVTVAAPRSITIVAPAGGETFAAGSTVDVRWAAPSVEAVVLEVSTDDGDNWSALTTGQALFATDPTWGDFPWQISTSLSGPAAIRVTDYNDHDLFAVSNLFSIAASGVGVRTVARQAPEGILGVDWKAGTLVVTARTGQGRADGAATVSAWSLSGTRLASVDVRTSDGLVRASLGDCRGMAVVKVQAGEETWTRTVVAW